MKKDTTTKKNENQNLIVNLINRINRLEKRLKAVEQKLDKTANPAEHLSKR